MVIDSETYIDTVFFVGGTDRDWMATLYKQGDGSWEIEARARLYDQDADGNTGEAFDGKDKKKFTHLAAKDGSDESRIEGLEGCRKVAQMVSAKLGAVVSEVPIKGGMADFIKIVTAQPWAHVRMERSSAWEE